MAKRNGIGKARKRIDDKLSEARDGITATVEDAANGANEAIRDVGDQIRHAGETAADAATSATDAVREGARGGALALRVQRRQLAAIAAAGATILLAAVAGWVARRKRPGGRDAA